MPSAKLRCFVAMAIGRSDTDKLYSRQINPALRSVGCVPVFMGRLEHNDDIDDRIIGELKKCDLAIADLAYARPSVYYEAGFAQRSVPVIYTCRRDHSKARSDDEHGNFRVHFDLLMKPIIWWANPEDSGFARRLSRRLAIVTRPLKKAKSGEHFHRQAKEDFASLSIQDKTQRLLTMAVNRLKRPGYKSALALDHREFWVGFRLKGRTLQLALVKAKDSFTRTDLKTLFADLLVWLRALIDPVSTLGFSASTETRRRAISHALSLAHRVKVNAILLSLRNLPPSKLQSALIAYRLFPKTGTYEWEGSESIGDRYLDAHHSVHVVDCVASQKVVAIQLRNMIASFTHR